MIQSIRINVFGDVQGVFYRQSAKEAAIKLGITGFVMNLPDGTVEITANGTKEQLEKYVSWCRHGPPKATVTDLKITELPLQQFDHFIIKRL